MAFQGNTRWARVIACFVGEAVLAAAHLGGVRAEPLDITAEPALIQAIDAAVLARDLLAMRPDYALYISELRPLTPDPRRNIYMALVQPGAPDPTRRGSAPVSGPGARNDIVFDESAITDGHTPAFRMLLLDHEYFHARHLAGTTSVPPPTRMAAEIERRFNEAAAWGFNIAEARDGRYPGLRAGELREALDRHRDHYVALKRLVQSHDEKAWPAISEMLRRPELLTSPDLPLEAGHAHPSGQGLASATP